MIEIESWLVAIPLIIVVWSVAVASVCFAVFVIRETFR